MAKGGEGKEGRGEREATLKTPSSRRNNGIRVHRRLDGRFFNIGLPFRFALFGIIFQCFYCFHCPFVLQISLTFGRILSENSAQVGSNVLPLTNRIVS